METIYIYTLTDPRTDLVRYVGLTRRPKKRYKRHLEEGRTYNKDKTNPHKRNWIRGILLDNLKPIMTIIFIAHSSAEADDSERRWIQFYNNRGCNLLNQTTGGEGAWGHSEETKRLIGLGNKGKLSGRTLSAAHKKNVSEGVRRSQTEEYRRKMSEIKRGKVSHVITDEIKAKIAATLRARWQQKFVESFNKEKI